MHLPLARARVRAGGGVMCASDDGYATQVWNERALRARKTYVCSECYRSIVPGELYRYLFVVVDGEPGVERAHMACAFLAAVLGELLCGGNYGIGQLHEHLREAGIRPTGSKYDANDTPVLSDAVRERIRDFYLVEVMA